MRKKGLVCFISDEFDWGMIEKGIYPQIIFEDDKARYLRFRTKVRITIEELTPKKLGKEGK